jgi:hypothetical protein
VETSDTNQQPIASVVTPASRRAAHWTFVGITAALLPLMILASFDFGVTWDELSRHEYGIKVWEFLRGLRPRLSFAETGGHVYPGLFDTICAAAAEWLPWNRFTIRHVINAIFGWVGIVYCGRLAGRLFGPWAAVLGALLLALSPRYFAASMNNPKDLPFAAMSVAALYYISTVSPRWPYLPLGTAIKIALSIALALSIRVGGLLYLGYFGILIAALILIERQTDWRRLADTAARVAAIVVAVLLLGTLFWPWAGGAPFTRPFEALIGAGGYPWNGSVLFAGTEYLAQELPWQYAPWWFAISTPLITLAGAALSPLFVSSRADALRLAGLWGVFALPIAAAIIMGSTLYDAVRHLMFVRPVLVLISVAGWAGLLGAVRPRAVRAAAGATLAVGLVSLVIFNVRFHPNQGVYFNSLVGGPSGAFKQYDMDYWGNCMFQSAQWAARAARRLGTTVTITGDPLHLLQQNAERLPELDVSFNSERKHHLAIDMARGQLSDFRDLVEGCRCTKYAPLTARSSVRSHPAPPFARWGRKRRPNSHGRGYREPAGRRTAVALGRHPHL